jgi:hypothetical protein
MWNKIEDCTPEMDTPVMVYTPRDIHGTPAIMVDMWSEIHEAPVPFSSQTICVGEGWQTHDDCEITHWMPLPASPTAELVEGSNLQHTTDQTQH